VERAILATIITSISQGAIVLSCDFKIAFCNRAFLDITGYDELEIMGQEFALLNGPDTDPAMLAKIAAAVADGQEFAGEILQYRKSGEPFWNELTLAPQRLEDGSVVRYVGVVRDITGKKLDALKLARLEADYRLIFNHAQAALVLHKADTTILYANPMAHKLLGVEAENIVGAVNTDERWQFIRDTGELLPIAEYPVNRAVAERKPLFNIEFGHRRVSDGQLTWLICSAFPVLNDAGEVTEVLTSFTDVTDLKNHERAAQLARERFELVARATLDVVFDWDLEIGTFWANPNFEPMFGFAPFDMVMLDEFQAIHVYEEDRPAVLADLRAAVAAGQDRIVQEYRFIRADGVVGYAKAFAMIIRSPAGTAVRLIGTLSDITDIKETDRKLQVSEERFRVVAGLSNDVVWDWDLETGNIWRSEGLVRKLGFDPAERQAGYDFWAENIHPDDRELINQAMAAAIAGEDLMWAAEYRFIDSANGIRFMQDRAAIIRNSDGKAVRLLGSMTDVTRQRELDNRLRQSQKLEAIGQLTGGVAHDFNNLLMVIGGNAELLQDLDLPPEAREMIGLIETAATHGAELTSHLLSFARKQPLAPRALQIGEELARSAALLGRVLPENIAIAVNIGQGLWEAEADAGQLESALVNVCLNARDAMPAGGRVTFAASNRAVGEELRSIDPDLKPGDYVEILVTDTGTGIAPDVLEKVFDPFFTTKPTGQGTGLGLSMVYGFAKQSGGHVSLTSEVGVGTTVCLLLPRARRQVAASTPDDVHEALPRGSETILLVEDNDLVRTHVDKQLRLLGYTVVTSANAQQALAELKTARPIDLLFSDIVMPGAMDGIRLAEAAAKLRPELKVLLTSGYSEKTINRSDDTGLAVKLLPKPYSRALLATTLRSLFASPS
jgi:PAS domain S-box-containing protein